MVKQKKKMEFKKVDEPYKHTFQPVYWENIEDDCNKFWAIHIIKKTDKANCILKYILIRKWGKIGTKPQTLEQEFDDKDKAEKTLKELIWQKERKGYKPVF